MFSVWRFKVSAGAAVITVLLQNTCTCLHWVLMLVFQITIRSSYTILDLRCHHHGRSNEGQQECGNGDCIQLINEEGNDQNIFSQRYPAVLRCEVRKGVSCNSRHRGLYPTGDCGLDDM